jgi:predicted dehydrogenase
MIELSFKRTFVNAQNADKPLRFAVIGCGAFAREAHLPNILRSKRMVLQTCVDIDPEVLAECRRRFAPLQTSQDYRAVIADPDVDAICLGTTEKLRLPVIELAARAGKPIYVEKPLARTMEEMYRIQQVVRESNIPFAVGHNRRCSPAMIEAERLFRAHMRDHRPCPWRWEREKDRPHLPEDGVPMMSVRINDDWHSWKKWVFDKDQAPHGPMLFEMTHFTDVCNWFLASEPIEVTAVESGMLNQTTTIRYANGALATIAMGGNGSFGYGKELYELMGNGGYLAIDHMVEVRTAGIVDAPACQIFPMISDRHPDVGTEGGMSGWLAKKRAACQDAVEKGDPLLQFTAEPDKGHAHALERFVDQIHGHGPEVCGVDAAVLATRVSFAAIRSAKQRRTVLMSEI